MQAERLEWPLVGRDRELARIAAAREAGAGTGVVLSAPAGVGKSRLARHAVQVAEGDGALVRWVQATGSAAAVPLGAFADLLPADTGSGEPLALMRRSAAALRAEAGGRPIVLGVDDAQLLDPTSAALVLHLASIRTAFVVVTVRDGEARPDAVEALWKDAGALRLALEPLDEAQTGRLIEAALGAPVEERVRRWVFDSSRGNVMYVRELLLGALADGALEDRGGFWRLARRPPPSASLTELIGARLDGLAPYERRALELLALGEPLPLAELVELVGTDPIAEVELRGLAVFDDAGNARLAHPLYGEVVRGTMPMIRARAARLRLAELVQARPRRTPGDALRVARWLLDAGEPVEPGLAVEAAGAANLAVDADLGARLASIAVEGGAGLPAALALARAHAMRARFDDAEAVLAGAEAESAEPDLAYEYLEQRVALLYWALRRPEEALDLVARAVGWWPSLAWRSRTEPLRLYLLMLAHEHDAALEGAAALLADPELGPDVHRRTEVVRAGTLFYDGQGRAAHALARGLRPTVPLRDTNEQIALDVCAMVDAETGEDLAETVAWLERTHRAAVAADDDAAAGVAALTLADLRRVAGRLHDAERWAAEAVVHFERRDPFAYLALAYAQEVGIAYEQGDAERAAAAFELHRAALDDEATDDTELAYRARAEAWALLAAGDPPAAQALLLDAARRCAPMPLYATQLTYEAMRAGAPARALLPGISALRERSDARLAAAYAAHVEARADGDGARLLEAADELAAIGAGRFASECAAHAAEAFTAAGRQDSARRAAARSRELHEQGQGGVPPAIRGVDEAATALTAREAQLVDLASRGLSNAEIADRLVVSVRTVESHLYRAMQKLGVSDRRELRAR